MFHFPGASCPDVIKKKLKEVQESLVLKANTTFNSPPLCPSKKTLIFMLYSRWKQVRMGQALWYVSGVQGWLAEVHPGVGVPEHPCSRAGWQVEDFFQEGPCSITSRWTTSTWVWILSHLLCPERTWWRSTGTRLQYWTSLPEKPLTICTSQIWISQTRKTQCNYISGQLCVLVWFFWTM